MACLGGRAELSLLQAATGEPAGVVEQALAPALDEGLLVAEPGRASGGAVPPRPHPRGDPGGLDPRRRRDLQLAMARRLAAVPELFAVAAEQYLPVVDAVDDPAERRQVVGLLRRAAGQAALIGDYVLVNALLAAALRLIDPGETATLVEVHTGRHAALYSLGRLEEADEEYRTIEGLRPTALERADATAVQVRSLTHRNRSRGGDRPRPGVAAGARHRRPGRGPAARRARPPVRLPVPVAGPHRRRRRSGPAGDHRPGAARRDPSDRRGHAGGLLRRRPRHVSPG